MPSRSAATRIGGGYLGADAEPEAARPRTCRSSWPPSRRSSASRGSARCRGPACTARRTGTPFQRSTITLRDEPMPMREPARRGVGQRGDALGEAGRGPGVGGDDGRAEPQPRLPRRGEGERREGVGAVGLGRPDVGVAEVGQLGEPVARGCAAARAAARSCRGGRAGHAGLPRSSTGRRGLGRRSARSPAAVLQKRTMQLWLAVASSVPSSANMCTRPWPKPRSTAWTRMSSSTHSVGTRCDDAQRVVEAVAAAADAERLADAHRHEVAEDRRARRRRRRRARRGCAPTAACWPSPGVPSSSSEVAALGEALVEPVVDRAVDRDRAAAAAGSPPGGARRRHRAPTARPGRTAGGRARR